MGKEGMTPFELIVPHSLTLVILSIAYGKLAGMSLRNSDDRYSYKSFTLPGNPFVQQLLVHRSMMAVFQIGFMVYSLMNLKLEIAIVLLSLLPVFVQLKLWYDGNELYQKSHLVVSVACWVGIAELVNNG